MDTAAPFRFRDVPRPEDAAAVGGLVGRTGFFSTAEIQVARELVEERLAKGAACGYEFLFIDLDGVPAGYICYGDIPLTEGNYQIYWIAVEPARQGRGIGRALVTEAERRVRSRGGRHLYIDTASREQYEPTRLFYRDCGYEEAAYLPDFYSPGDGKRILRKKLQRLRCSHRVHRGSRTGGHAAGSDTLC